jgi:hypothetical protein
MFGYSAGMVELNPTHRGTVDLIRSPSNAKIQFNEDLVHLTRTRHEQPAFLCTFFREYIY